MTREEWLTIAATLIMDGIVGPHGALTANPPKWQVACGWPSRNALSSSRRRIGECWSPEFCRDGATFQVFISPVLNEPVQGDGDGVLPVLVHELVHVVAGEGGHRGRFKQVAVAVGLTGKMTATVAGSELCEKLAEIVRQLGPYPHAGIEAASRRRKQSTRMIKVMAVNCTSCSYVARTTRKWIETVGLPRCPHGSLMEEAE
jgi:hypothetical protein